MAHILRVASAGRSLDRHVWNTISVCASLCTSSSSVSSSTSLSPPHALNSHNFPTLASPPLPAIPFLPPTSAYVHLPFCRRRCFYCDFPVVPLGRTRHSQHLQTMEDYVVLVCREISATAAATPGGPLTTVFFGGGTPSLLPPHLLRRILDCLQASFGFCPVMEISMELDPGTFNEASLMELIDHGVNRFSLGVQSFNQKLLEASGRSHSLKEVYDAIDIIHQNCRLKNWSLDLISSLPFLTPQMWMHSLTEAVQASPSHISVYDLQIEQGTKFGDWYSSGKYPLPCENDSAEFYRTASCKLNEAGYDHYELSNYAKPGCECKHNLVYWHNLPYYAFGLGSTSYVKGMRFSRPRKMKSYTAFVDDLEESDGIHDCPVDSIEETILDTIMLSLRLSQGINLKEFYHCFGRSVTRSLCRGLEQYIESGHVKLLDITGQEFIDNDSHTTKGAPNLQALLGQDLPSILKDQTASETPTSVLAHRPELCLSSSQ